MTTAEILARLEQVTGKKARRNGSGWMTTCPAHDDRVPSLSVKEEADGKTLLHCFVCSKAAVLDAADLTLADLFDDKESSWRSPTPRRRERPRTPTPEEREEVLERQRRYTEALAGHERLQHRLLELRGWTYDAIQTLAVGWDVDTQRVTFPVTSDGTLRGHLRYDPGGGPQKMLSDTGVPRELFPAPETTETEGWLFLTEGEPDAVLLTSIGLQAVGVGGVKVWKPTDPERFTDRDVAVLVDTDEEGREFGERLRADLLPRVNRLALLDLAEIAEAIPRIDGAKDVTEAALRLHVAKREGFGKYLHDRAEMTAEAGVDGNPASKNAAKTAPEGGGVVLLDPRTMTMRRPDYLLDNARIPIGMTTILAGDGGLGKSLYAVMLAAQVTQAGHAVIFSTAEDDRAKTWLPRLAAAGADMSLIRLIRVVHHGELEWDEPIALPEHVIELRDAIRSFQAESGTTVKLVIIDPLETHLSDERDDGSSSTRRRVALGPMESLANAEDVAVLFIHHINKSSGQKASHRILGTVANRNAPRSGLIFGHDPDEVLEPGVKGVRRCLYHDKHNTTAQAPTQVFQVQPGFVPTENGDEIPTVKLVYIGESVASGEDILGDGLDRDEEKTARDEAWEFLQGELVDGPQPVTSVNKNAQGLGISIRTLERARRDHEVESSAKEAAGTFGFRWPTTLIQDRQKTSQTARGTMVAVLSKPLRRQGLRAILRLRPPRAYEYPMVAAVLAFLLLASLSSATTRQGDDDRGGQGRPRLPRLRLPLREGLGRLMAALPLPLLPPLTLEQLRLLAIAVLAELELIGALAPLDALTLRKVLAP